MSHLELENEVPSSILTSLEDLTADIVDLQELILALAATAQYLPGSMAFDSSESVH
jgi:hypothetical protein